MDRRLYPTRVAKLGEAEDDAYLQELGAADRLRMVWTLTRLAWAFHGESSDEPRLRRDVGRIVRGRG